MLEVFDSMALRGNADARSMASGVSAAMICTMTGLAVRPKAAPRGAR
jgi:biopolymer transport protein ExbB